MVLYAYERLHSEGVRDCLFIVDCDGASNASWLGREGLVVSDNRDVDADLLLSLGAFRRVALEFLSDHADTAERCSVLAQNMLDHATFLTSMFGAVLDSARSVGRPVKIFDPTLGRRRRLRLTDLPELHDWVGNFVYAGTGDIATAAAAQLAWSDEDVAMILAAAAVSSRKRCRAHAASSCASCTPRNYSSGHDLADTLAVALTQRCGFDVGPGEFARAVRIATHAGGIDGWSMGRRIHEWRRTRGTA